MGLVVAKGVLVVKLVNGLGVGDYAVLVKNSFAPRLVKITAINPPALVSYEANGVEGQHGFGGDFLTLENALSIYTPIQTDITQLLERVRQELSTKHSEEAT